MKALYKLQFDCGRMGELTGLFVAHKEHVQKLLETKETIYFGEVLGKHSDVSGPLDKTDVKFVSDDPELIKTVKKFKLEVGYNPIDYVLDQNPEFFK